MLGLSDGPDIPSKESKRLRLSYFAPRLSQDWPEAQQQLTEEEVLAAEPSFDVWSFGTVMFQMCTRSKVFHCDDGDNINNMKLRELALWRTDAMHDKLGQVQELGAKKLLLELLEEDATSRLDMKAVLKHPFFLTDGVDTKEEIIDAIKEVGKNVEGKMNIIEVRHTVMGNSFTPTTSPIPVISYN